MGIYVCIKSMGNLFNTLKGTMNFEKSENTNFVFCIKIKEISISLYLAERVS